MYEVDPRDVVTDEARGKEDEQCNLTHRRS